MKIELTEVAAEEIGKIIRHQKLDPQTVRLRVAVEGGGAQRKYILDLTEHMNEDELALESQGIQIICPQKQMSLLDGAAIDFREQPAVGWGFTVDLPVKRQITRQEVDSSQPLPTEQEVRAALHEVIDPEVGVNIVDLGLVYGITIEGRDVRITMTMTTPACPLSDLIRREVDERLRERCPGVDAVEVELVWEPRWTSEQISPAGKQQLGWARR